jgi:hypothetical protein
MNFIERILTQMGIAKLFNAIDGYKTYILAALNVAAALAGHFWGPIQIAGGTIPKESWNDVWAVVNATGFVTLLRHGISKSGPGGTS